MCAISSKLGYIIILSIIILSSIYKINSLIRIPQPINNHIITAESKIRTSLNDIYKDFKHNNNNKKIVDPNNFFTSLILQDNNLQNVDSMSRLSLQKTNVSDYVNVLNEIIIENIGANRTRPTNENIAEIYDVFKLIDNKNKSQDINAEVMNNVNFKTLRKNDNMNSTENNTLFSDLEFWELSARRIYHGRLTKIKYFPFMAVVQFFGKFTCAGSIIKSDLVISAASCVQLAYNNRFFRENPSFLSVRVGSTFYSGGGEVIPVQEVYFHPRYNPKNLRHNLCLLRLVRRLKFRRRTRRVKKIEVDRNPSALSLTTDGIIVIGWGAQDSSNIIHEPWKNRIAFSTLDIYPLRECQRIYSEEYVTKFNFCAGFMAKGGGACNQDVGGPGVVNGKLAGVISFGSPVCGTPDAPTVFTKLGFYKDWIGEIMDQDVPHSKKRTTLKEKFTFTLSPVRKITQPTKFKISPLEDLSTIQQKGNVEVNTEEEIFKQFLKTMFGSTEVEEYMERPNTKVIVDKMIERFQKVEDTSDDNNERLVNNSKQSFKKDLKQVAIEDYDENLVLVTKSPEDYVDSENSDPVIDFQDITTQKTKLSSSSEEDSTQSSEEVAKTTTKYTEFQTTLQKDEEKLLENDIVKLIDNMQLENLIDEVRSSEQVNTEIDKVNLKSVQNRKNVDDSVLTLLYFSDKEQKETVVNKNRPNEDVLIIPGENFKDITTYRNNSTK